MRIFFKYAVDYQNGEIFVMDNMLEVGKIINTHGLRGDVKVVAWTDVPEDFEHIKKVYTKDAVLTVVSVKYQKNNLILKFKEISSIEEAEQYKNCILKTDKSELPPLPEGVYYVADLIGCHVFDQEGAELGEVLDVFTAGAGNVYEVRTEIGKKLYLPANDTTIVSTDISAKKIVMNVPEGMED